MNWLKNYNNILKIQQINQNQQPPSHNKPKLLIFLKKQSSKDKNEGRSIVIGKEFRKCIVKIATNCVYLYACYKETFPCILFTVSFLFKIQSIIHLHIFELFTSHAFTRLLIYQICNQVFNFLNFLVSVTKFLYLDFLDLKFMP